MSTFQIQNFTGKVLKIKQPWQLLKKKIQPQTALEVEVKTFIRIFDENGEYLKLVNRVDKIPDVQWAVKPSFDIRNIEFENNIYKIPLGD